MQQQSFTPFVPLLWPYNSTPSIVCALAFLWPPDKPFWRLKPAENYSFSLPQYPSSILRPPQPLPTPQLFEQGRVVSCWFSFCNPWCGQTSCSDDKQVITWLSMKLSFSSIDICFNSTTASHNPPSLQLVLASSFLILLQFFWEEWSKQKMPDEQVSFTMALIGDVLLCFIERPRVF